MMNTKQELIQLLDEIILYFKIQAQYGGFEKNIYNYYKKVLDKCDMFTFNDIIIHNWSRAYLEANSDWDNPILDKMNKADLLIEHFQKISK